MVVCEYGCRPFVRALGRMAAALTEMSERVQVRYERPQDRIPYSIVDGKTQDTCRCRIR
jgi:hypothetical protein